MVIEKTATPPIYNLSLENATCHQAIIYKDEYITDLTRLSTTDFHKIGKTP